MTTTTNRTEKYRNVFQYIDTFIYTYIYIKHYIGYNTVHALLYIFSIGVNTKILINILSDRFKYQEKSIMYTNNKW
jgi:hypothetical protein